MDTAIIAQGVLLGGAALAASAIAAVAGFGGAAVLLPPLVAVFGVRDAIPILTVAQLIGNGSSEVNKKLRKASLKTNSPS